MRSGGNWQERVKRELRKADAIVFLVDRNFSQREFLPQSEVSAAVEASWNDPKKRLVPVLVGSVRTPPFLRDRKGVRVARPQRKLAAAKKVVAALKGDAGSVDQAERERRLVQYRNRLREIERQAIALWG